MAGKSYVGQNTRFHDVIDMTDGWIELRVYHENIGVRNSLQAHLTNPSYFLERREAFHRSQTRAEQQLAAVIDDYRSYFAQNRVKITFA